jgi:hypothetical protein
MYEYAADCRVGSSMLIYHLEWQKFPLRMCSRSARWPATDRERNKRRELSLQLLGRDFGGDGNIQLCSMYSTPKSQSGTAATVPATTKVAFPVTEDR